MDVKQIRKANLQLLKDEAKSWAEVARRAGTEASYLSQITSARGTREIGDELARKLEKGFRKPHGWMDQDHAINRTDEKMTAITQSAVGVLSWDEDNPPPSDQFVLIPRLDVKLSAGHGTVTFEVDEKQPLAFRSDWLADLGVNPKKVAIMQAKGDSMEEKISDGDTLFIDVSQTNVIDNKIYAIRYGDELRVKRLLKHFSGGLKLISINPAYPEEVIRPEDMQFVEVLGRVVWSGGTL